MNEARDEIARLLRETYDREFDGEGGEWNAMADALLAAGLVVPSGLTADALDVLLNDIESGENGSAYRTVRAWADALSTQENTQ